MNIPFQQAKHFRPGPRKAVDWVVIHTAEIGESHLSAEGLMRACAATPTVKSWHYAVDDDSITQSVGETDIAFHAPGANAAGIGIELSGRAGQTSAQWFDAYSLSTLANAAKLAAEICERWFIPSNFVDATGLLQGLRGITTHAEVSKAFKKSNHMDPGPNFPTAKFVELVRALRGSRTGFSG